MHLFYCPHSDLSSNQAVIDDKEELHHLRKVLRLKKGDEVHVFDGKGREASGNLLSVAPHQAEVELRRVREAKPRIPKLILACAIPKKSKFETIIEKATELGADEIIPLKTQRTEVKLSGERETKKQHRFETVAINAAKQSKRHFIPAIHPVTDFSEAVAELASSSQAIIPSLQEKSRDLIHVLEDLRSPKAVSFLIGPEGDFTEEEYALAEARGCIPATLGPTVLKVETAALCVLSCANCLFHA